MKLLCELTSNARAVRALPSAHFADVIRAAAAADAAAAAVAQFA